MTKEERKLALYCLKASSDYHSEVCEECINYPNCDHTIQDDVTETIIKELEQEPCEDAISRQAVCDTTICDGISCNECSFNTCEDGQSGCLLKERIEKIPPVTPQHTDVEIQKMQELEQAEIKKAYELGKADILEKIRAEIETKYGQCDICEYFEDYDYEENDISEYQCVGDVSDILAIIDKYKAESEAEE